MSRLGSFAAYVEVIKEIQVPLSAPFAA